MNLITTMKKLHSSNNIPGCLILSIALIQAELFWICSAVICCLNRSTKTISIHNNQKQHSSLNKDNSVALESIKKEEMVVVVVEQPICTENIELSRRLSLPTLPARNENTTIRVRPSIHDEINGKTCPPIWWQKAKIKLTRVESALHKRTPSSSSYDTIDDATMSTSTSGSLQYPTELTFVPSLYKTLSKSSTESSCSRSFEKSRERTKQFKAKIKAGLIKIARHRRSSSLEA